MDRGRAEGQSIGQITSGINQGNTLALKTIDFVRQQLPVWRDDPDRSDERSEGKLNYQLCSFLGSSRVRNDFPMIQFINEVPQPKRRRVDLAASPSESMIIEAKLYTTYDPILVFECKRLPAPSLDREKEYVTRRIGRRISGGIQRFKLGLHGADLDLAAMVGYVQERSARDWHNEINGWISELSIGTIADGCAWNGSEALEPLEEDMLKGIASCRSVHSRTGSMSNEEITIHHLWIAMNTG